MQSFKIKIKGNPAFPFYMQHRMDDKKLAEWEKNRSLLIERDDVNKDDSVKAEYHSYINNKGEFYLPAEHVKCALINGGKTVKGKVGASTKTMTSTVAGMFYVLSEEGTEELPLSPQEYLIDKRSAVNTNVKARIITVRPKWKDWFTTLILNVDNDTLTKETIREIVENAGKYVGIGSYRPEHKGPFGRYIIESMEPA